MQGHSTAALSFFRSNQGRASNGIKRAGLILYLLDVTFRIAQQAYPVRLRVASVHDKAQLATLQYDMDPLTPQDPIQASLLWSLLAS